MNSETKHYHEVSFSCSRYFTRSYSSSFSLAVSLLTPEIRQGIYSIYGFVRVADEVVDSFHEHNKELLLDRFSDELMIALREGISTNPVINSFQLIVRKYNIGMDLIEAFLKSMRTDLDKMTFNTNEYEEYIYGSADVVGLMCLRVFTGGDDRQYELLKQPAMKLGSAFQKVNFLRDIKNDYEKLNRKYFPDVDLDYFSQSDKEKIIEEIEDDFMEARKGILKLPGSSRLAVYVAYLYYHNLLKRLKRTDPSEIMNRRIRVPHIVKLSILAQSWLRHRVNMI
jgi:15-cis-phytoene synthase